MYHFCTISTTSHMYKTMALCQSLVAQGQPVHLHVLCTDGMVAANEHITGYTITDIAAQQPAALILSKYQQHPDKLRWSMKPVFLNYLLTNVADKVIYLDNDIYFYNDFTFLFTLLDEHSFLLTPHNYPRNPWKNQNWLEANFKVGLYNAGFVGVSKAAFSSLQWWADCCAYRCEKNPLRGTFDDQKYLDLIPVIDEKAHILRHKGCNVAEWNRSLIPRIIINGKVMLDGTYPLVFIHFNGTTVKAILNSEEPCLKECFEVYLAALKKYKPELKTENIYSNETLLSKLKYEIWKHATAMGI